MNQTLLISETELEKMIAARVREAVTAEREACAKVSEQGAKLWSEDKANNKRVHDVLLAVAEDIRARKDASDGGVVS